MFPKALRALALLPLLLVGPAPPVAAVPIVTQVSGNGDDIADGRSLRWAMDTGPQVDEENLITFTDNLFNDTISVGSTLPVVDIGADGTLEIDARFVTDPDTPLQVRLERLLDEGESPEAFFDVTSGALTLNELEFNWDTPEDGDPEIIAFEVASGASLTYVTERELDIGEGLAGEGTLIKDGSHVVSDVASHTHGDAFISEHFCNCVSGSTTTDGKWIFNDFNDFCIFIKKQKIRSTRSSLADLCVLCHIHCCDRYAHGVDLFV